MSKHHHDTLKLKADGDHILEWKANASFVVSIDLKSVTGTTLTLSQKSNQTVSSKQNINTSSSTNQRLFQLMTLFPKKVI